MTMMLSALKLRSIPFFITKKHIIVSLEIIQGLKRVFILYIAMMGRK